MEKNNAGSRQRRKTAVSAAIAAAVLAFMFLPATGSASILTLSTAIASPGNGHQDDGGSKEHCPPGINHVPRDSHAYDVLKHKCDGDDKHEDKEQGNPHNDKENGHGEKDNGDKQKDKHGQHDD